MPSRLARRRMTKSPVALARQALALGQHSLPAYSSRRSRKDFTCAQLFAILVLRQFLKTDYRGMEQMLADFSDLQRVLQLKKVPHFTTLQKAEARLLKKRRSRPAGRNLPRSPPPRLGPGEGYGQPGRHRAGEPPHQPPLFGPLRAHQTLPPLGEAGLPLR